MKISMGIIHSVAESRLKQTTSLEGSTSRSASVRSFAGGRADEPQLGLPCLELRAGDGAPGGEGKPWRKPWVKQVCFYL